MEYYGIRVTDLQLIQSYLSNRMQSVHINGTYSNFSVVGTGVPQGSVLGPLLFLIMNNDLPSNVRCETILFADDTTLYNSNPDINFLNHTISDSFIEASHWFTANGLSLNASSKTQRILFSLKNTLNSNCCNMTVPNVKLLGIIIDSKLTWDSHIDMICCKLARVIHLLRHLKPLVPKQYLKTAYFAFLIVY